MVSLIFRTYIFFIGIYIFLSSITPTKMRFQGQSFGVCCVTQLNMLIEHAVIGHMPCQQTTSLCRSTCQFSMTRATFLSEKKKNITILTCRSIQTNDRHIRIAFLYFPTQKNIRLANKSVRFFPQINSGAQKSMYSVYSLIMHTRKNM